LPDFSPFVGKCMGTTKMAEEKKPTSSASHREPWILIAGLGNLLLRDAGVGVHAVHELQQDPPPGARVVEVGTAVLDALHLFNEADRILAIDAMQAGGSPGTLYSVEVSGVEDRGPQASLHELNLMAAFGFLPDGGRPPVAFVGVEPAVIDYGLDLSPEVQSALPVLIQSVREVVDSWQRETSEEEEAVADLHPFSPNPLLPNLKPSTRLRKSATCNIKSAI
jgi:hydrogenase maturation protease